MYKFGVCSTPYLPWFSQSLAFEPTSARALNGLLRRHMLDTLSVLFFFLDTLIWREQTDYNRKKKLSRSIKIKRSMLTFMARLGQVDRKDSNSLENKCTLDANTCELKIGSAACSWKTVSFRPTTTTMTIPGPFQAFYPKKQSVIPNKKQSNIVMTHAWSMFLVPVSSNYWRPNFV